MDKYLVTSKTGKKFWRTKTKRKKKALSSFDKAFSDYRKKLGAGKTFMYKGKKYTTDMKNEPKRKTKKEVVAKIVSNTPTYK